MFIRLLVRLKVGVTNDDDCLTNYGEEGINFQFLAKYVATMNSKLIQFWKERKMFWKGRKKRHSVSLYV